MIKLAQYNTLLRLGIVALLILAAAACDQPTPIELETLDLAVADSGAGRPTTAIDEERGTVYVAWTSKAGSETNVYLSRLAAGEDALSAPVRVNHLPGDAAGHGQAPAQVAVGPDGVVYVAWITQTVVPGRRFPASDIRLARSLDGARTFEPAVTVNEDAGFPTGHHFHNLVVGPGGTVYVSWLDSSERDRAQRQQEQLDGAAVVPVQHAGRHGHGGHAHEPDGLPGTELRVARSVDGGRSFEPSAVVAQGTCQCCRTALAVGRDGTVYVAWRHIFGENVRDIAFARSVDGGQTFSEPVRVHADQWKIDGCPHSGPSIAIDGKDGVHVIWYTGAEGAPGVYYTVSRDGGASFGTPEPLAPNAPGSQVSMTSRGDAVLMAWEDPAQKAVRLGRTEGTSGLALAGSVQGKLPSVFATENNLAVTWQDGEQVRVRVSRPVLP